jgi:hypothetical protein
MKYVEITKSNPIPEVSNSYCELLLEGMYFPYLETKGSPTTAWAQCIQDTLKESVVVHDIEDIEHSKRSFRIIEGVFTGFCNYLAQTAEEYTWTFENLLAILDKGEPRGGHSRVKGIFLKNASNRVLMHYLNTSDFRFPKEYSNTDVNLNRDVLMTAMNLLDPSTDASSISWLTGKLPTPQRAVVYNSTSGWVQQAVEKRWKEIQHTYLKILFELREMSAIYLEKLSQIPSEVLYFCFQQQILRHLPIVIEVIEKNFLITTNEIEMKPEIDPETGEEWLDFNIRVKGEVNEVLDKYDKYTDLLVSSVPSSARYYMRLSYNIV